MPELPEIEVLRLSLTPRLVGRRVRAVSVHDTRLREPIDPEGLRAAVVGERVEDLDRRSKYLLINLRNAQTLAVHLGMSGRLTLAPEETPREKHEHAAFHLDGGERLRFRDPRRFGLVFALPTASAPEDPHFAHLGPEPLAGGLDGATLRERATGRRSPVKNFLMDGRVVVGVGNIYACEALFRAGVHPKRSVARIASKRWQGLAEAVVETLGRAVEQGGTTLNDFADGEGNSGYFQVSLSVYGREGEPCTRCGQPIKRIVQAGRSTFFCGRCQR